MKLRMLAIGGLVLFAFLFILASCGGGRGGARTNNIAAPLVIGNQSAGGGGSADPPMSVSNTSFYGAIWTSLADGTQVDQNIYYAKEDVYINGGPQNNKGKGLPDEIYYFQVTDPSGATLLSSDNANQRQLQVVNGVIHGYYDAGYGHHANGTEDPADGTIPVQLIPYNDTPNSGGEYKVWLIRQTPDTYIDPNDPKVIIFNNDDSKTDNFKIKEQIPPPPGSVAISGHKFYDYNMNGIWDSGENPILGWQIELWQGSVLLQTTYTDSNGAYSFNVLQNSGTYTITEVPPSGQDWFSNGGSWIATTSTSGDVTVLLVDVAGPEFGNREGVNLYGHKFYDYNMNGVWDQSNVNETPIQDWVIQLWNADETVLLATTTTSFNGYYNFYVEPNSGPYVIKEVPPAGEDWFSNGGDWIATTDTFRDVDTVGLDDVAVPDFGNRHPVELSGYKFYDYNMNGTWDQNQSEYALEGWVIQLWQGTVMVASTTTDSNGYYSFKVEPNAGAYTIKEVPPSGQDWYPTGLWINTTDKEQTITVGLDDIGDIDFGNREAVKITVAKFYDLNTNGVWDTAEVPIPGWRIELWNGGTTPQYVAFTDSTGYVVIYAIPNPNGVTYTIKEVPPPAGWYPAGVWMHTTAITGTVTLMLDDVTGPVFGNVCLGAGGGKTLGFWSNKNGQAILNANPGWIALLDGLNLRNANGSNFDPTNYSGFRTWLLNASATNMAYMLSAQLSAMELNVNYGSVNGGSYIYAPGTNSANSSGFATVNAVMNEANTELGIHGTAYSGDAWRSYQEALKNALDKANNNLTFVMSGPCPFTTPY